MPRGPAPRVPNLDELKPRWVRVYCLGRDCNHSAPMALTPLVIRWGFGVSSDRLRQCARCTACGHRGAELKTPGWVDMIVGPEPFPVAEKGSPAPLPSS